MEIDIEFDTTYNGDGYPGSQYCLGDSNNFQCKGNPGASTNVTHVRFASNSHSDSVHTAATAGSALSSGSFTEVGTCRTSGLSGDGSFTAVDAYAYLEVKVGGVWRTREKKTDDTIRADFDTVPTFYLSSISYPAGQSALKGTETATVSLQHSNINGTYAATYSYTDPTSPDQLTISNPTTYSASKTVTSTDESVYNVSSNNFKLTATLGSYNGHSASSQVCVKVANVAPTLTMDTSQGDGVDDVFRSKSTGNKTYELRVTSNQLMNEVEIHRDASDNDASTIQIPSFSYDSGNSRWEANISIKDSDKKNTGVNTYTFTSGGTGSSFGKNIANFPTTSLSGDTTYKVRGFEARDIIDVPQYNSYHITGSAIGTQVSNFNNPAKLDAVWIGLGDANYVTNTTDVAGSKNFTIVNSSGNFDADGSIIKCNDPNIYNGFDWDINIEEKA